MEGGESGVETMTKGSTEPSVMEPKVEDTHSQQEICPRRSSRINAKTTLVRWFRKSNGFEEPVICTRVPLEDGTYIAPFLARTCKGEKDKPWGETLSDSVDLNYEHLKKRHSQRSTVRDSAITELKTYGMLRRDARAKRNCHSPLSWGERRKRTAHIKSRDDQRTIFWGPQHEYENFVEMQVDPQPATNSSGLIPKNLGILAVMLTENGFDCVSNSLAGSLESGEAGSSVWEQTAYSTGDTENYSVEEADSSVQGGEESSFEAHDRTESPILEQEKGVTLKKDKRSPFTEQPFALGASAPSPIQMTVLPEWVMLSENSRESSLVDITSGTPPCLEIQGKDLSSLEMPYTEKIMAHSNEFHLPSPTILTQIGFPDSFSSHVLAGDMSQNRESFVGLLSRMHGQGFSSSTHFDTDYHSGNPVTDAGMEYSGNLSSVNFSFVESNGQALSFSAADKSRDSFIEGGSNLVDLFNSEIQQHEQFCKKVRLSTLRSQIRGSGRSTCVYSAFGEHYKQGQFDLDDFAPQKHSKRKKHRPKVMREPRPVRNLHERKKQSQATKEKINSVDRDRASVHENFANEPNVQDNLGSICSSCEVDTSGAHSCVALKKCGNHWFDYWQALSCLGGSRYLDRSSGFQSLPSAARDQNRESILSNQEEVFLSYMVSNRGCMGGSLCDGFHNMHEQENNNSISSGDELNMRGKSGVTREDGFELSLQLKEQAIVQQTSTAACSQKEIEKISYPWNMNDRMGSMHSLHETQSTNIDRNSHACKANMMIDLENESLFSKYVPNVHTCEGVPCYDFMGGMTKTRSSSYLHAVGGWKDTASQHSPFSYGQYMQQEESLYCTNHSNLLQAHPSSVYKPDSEVSSISSITNPTQQDGQGTQLLDSNCLQVVPYQNKEIVLSRRGREKHRPKVQLDTETNRVWGLLENGGALPPEEDQEKARMWAKERAVMEERVDYFITRMHDVQGDRRFSQWKGSIVDSVVGAFLTQNVSDHLSSSAFMSLASKFPASPRNASSDLQETRNIAQSSMVQIPNGQPVALETTRIDGQSLLAECTNEGQSAAYKTMRIDDQALMAQCPDGQPMMTELMRVDMVECNFKNVESHSHDPSSTSETSDDPCIGNPLQCSPLQIHPFYGARTEISERVRRRLDFVENDILGKQHQTPLAIQKDPKSNCAEQTVRSQGNCDYIDNNLVVLSQELQNYPDTEATLPANHKTCLKPNSELQTVQAPDSVILAPGKGKKKLYKVSRISGIERAQIEVSQGGHKNRRKDWESMRQQVLAVSGVETCNSTFEQGNRSSPQDTVNWEAVRLADIANVADAIKERGMHNILSGRIKAFLTRLHEEHGNINLEWVRGLSVENAREYLLDIRGLGIKSVECIRLLTLQHLAFPVDTNVGRICVRLGWVPIEPLPEELQLHLLELYPVQETIQKYLWPRLCTLDQRTLYELHYQMITFGKVFCTKSKPNCNSCPMRGECKHFASAYASSKLSLTSSSSETNSVDLPALPGPRIDAEKTCTSIIKHEQLQQTFSQIQICEPIIEEPTTPDHGCTEYMSDIEDSYSIYSKPSDYSDPIYLENFAMIELPSEERAFDMLGEQGSLVIEFEGTCCSRTASEEHSHLSQSFASDFTSEWPSYQSQSTASDLTSERDSFQSGISVVEFTSGKGLYESQSIIPDVPSNAIVPLPLEYAYLPVPKLKNVGRLRTVHYVYEIPDGHHLIREMDTREKDDPCFYLLAIWSPDEVPQSPDEMDNCCKKDSYMSPCRTMFGQDEIVKGTLLIPCRTATHGSFPLNGTFFQVNEVFADHKSSLHPLEVPRTWIWNLRRRFVYFGTSIPSIFRGLSTEEIKLCFWRGHVCVRGFDRESRAPKPLVARLHFPASRQMKAPKNQTKKAQIEKVLSDHV